MQPQAEVFTEVRPIFTGLAKRMLGSGPEAEDIAQEAYVRWQKTETRTVRSPRASLTTVVTPRPHLPFDLCYSGATQKCFWKLRA